jgi:hypothetical protein
MIVALRATTPLNEAESNAGHGREGSRISATTPVTPAPAETR